jgi:hypothetical protein
MAFDLGPYFFKVNYSQIGYGLHVMTHSIDEWIDTSSTNNQGRIKTHDGGDVDAVDGMTTFLELLEPFFNGDVSFNNWVIYRQLDPEDIPTPVASAQLVDFDGTDVTAGWHVATEMTLTWRTAGFNIFKLTLLDCQSRNDFSKIVIMPGSGRLFDLHTYLTGDDNFVIGRDSEYPALFLSQTTTLNEKLRRADRLT